MLVLFADLVGFTAASEGRDAEDTRELLSRYFDTARTIVERYGGIVEKFIGDAVMAVWGAPVAKKTTPSAPSARRSTSSPPFPRSTRRSRPGPACSPVRPRSRSAPRARAWSPATSSTPRRASSRWPSRARCSSARPRSGRRRRRSPTRTRASTSSRARHEAVHLWQRARIVAAQRRGEGRAIGLEAPFVGRTQSFASSRISSTGAPRKGERRLVSVVGVAGIGKSRLSWEFEKYVDGLAATSGGTGDAASPMETGSPSGRWRR